MNAIEAIPQNAKTKIRVENLAPETIGRIIELREKGRSFRVIARDVGISHGTVQRIVKREESGSPLQRAKPSLPKRPRNGQQVLPDFERVAKLALEGKTIKECWQVYAQATAKAYTYEYFSTLFNVWLEENKAASLPVVQSDVLSAEAKSLVIEHECPILEDVEAERFWKRRISPSSETLALYGYGASLSVKNGELVSFNEGTERRFPKVVHGLASAIFMGSPASISTEAIKWCDAQGVGMFITGYDGDLICVFTPSFSANVGLRRAQFAADRLQVAKAILKEKLASGARVGKLSSEALAKASRGLKLAKSVDDLLTIEAQAALDYWSNCRFTLKHRRRNWPDQWTTFHYRASLISGGPRHATHPVNAILNYAYTCVAAQLARTLAAHGLDPACGFLHADADGRYSLAYDAIELLRADIDAALLPWVAATTWRRADFPVTPSGVVRLQPTLAAVVAQRISWACPQTKLDAAVEWIRDTIVKRCLNGKSDRCLYAESGELY